MSQTPEIIFIYASTSGNVEAVVDRVAEVLTKEGWSVVKHRAEETAIEIITTNQVFVLATSTWEHGVLNPFFAKLYKEMQKTQFEGKTAAFIGLGDRRYEPVLFCEGMETVRRTWLANKGTELQEPLKINGEPYGLLDSVVTPWALKLNQSLRNSQPSGILGSVKKWLG